MTSGRNLHTAPEQPQRVVVLGATGFVARDLVRQLSEAQIECRAIGSSEIDLLQPQSPAQLQAVLRESDTLVLTSALTPDKGKDVRTFMKNITMVDHVCAALESVRPSHVVYISSDAVYDDADPLVRETSPATGQGLYGTMHLAREKMLAFVSAAGDPIPLCIVRPCNVYGAGDTHNSYGPNRFMRSASRERRITLFGNGEEQRDHVYVRDLSRFLESCILHRTEGTVNCASGTSTAFAGVATAIAALSATPVTIERLQRAAGSVITHRRFDLALSQRLLPGFAFTSLETGLAESWKEIAAQHG